MDKFEDLFVPPPTETLHQPIRGRQSIACDRARVGGGCRNICCEECVYHESNIGAFVRYEKQGDNNETYQ